MSVEPLPCAKATCGNVPFVQIVAIVAVGCRYEEDADRRERFYYTMLGGGGTPPASACPDVARLVVQQHFNCPSAWCILPLQVRQAGSTSGCIEHVHVDALVSLQLPLAGPEALRVCLREGRVS